jgi:hypothetical protein
MRALTGTLTVGFTGGRSRAPVARSAVTEVTSYRGRQEFGGLKTDQLKRMKELEAENTRLRRTVSDLTLDKMILADGNEILSKRMIAKQQRRRNRWTLQPCLDVRISVLNKTLQRSIQRRYPAFQTPNDQPALNYSGYQIKKSVETNCARSSAGPNSRRRLLPRRLQRDFRLQRRINLASRLLRHHPLRLVNKAANFQLTPLVPKIGSISQKPPVKDRRAKLGSFAVSPRLCSPQKFHYKSRTEQFSHLRVCG